MNQFEKVALITTIEVMEKQLQAMKVMITAATGGTTPAQPTHKTTKFDVPSETSELSDEEEDKLQAAINENLEKETSRMANAAEKHFQTQFAAAQANLDKQ